MKNKSSIAIDNFMKIANVFVHSLGVVFFTNAVAHEVPQIIDTFQNIIQQPTLENFGTLGIKSLIVAGEAYLTCHFGNKLLKDAGLKNSNSDFSLKNKSLKI